MTPRSSSLKNLLLRRGSSTLRGHSELNLQRVGRSSEWGRSGSDSGASRQSFGSIVSQSSIANSQSGDILSISKTHRAIGAMGLIATQYGPVHLTSTNQQSSGYSVDCPQSASGSFSMSLEGQGGPSQSSAIRRSVSNEDQSYSSPSHTHISHFAMRQVSFHVDILKNKWATF